MGTAPDLIKKAWLRVALRGVRYSDDHGRLDRAYRVPNPWRMDSELERFRFAETNRLILDNFGKVGTLLEVGCGEGHQSARLLEVCQELHGIDVSPRAVERAQARCPEGVFSIGDLSAPDLAPPGGHFDLVVACEVLYYMRDVPAALGRMNALGRRCLATYFDAEIGDMDPYVRDIAGLRSAEFAFEGTRWKAVWWEP